MFTESETQTSGFKVEVKEIYINEIENEHRKRPQCGGFLSKTIIAFQRKHLPTSDLFPHNHQVRVLSRIRFVQMEAQICAKVQKCGGSGSGRRSSSPTSLYGYRPDVTRQHTPYTPGPRQPRTDTHHSRVSALTVALADLSTAIFVRGEVILVSENRRSRA